MNIDGIEIGNGNPCRFIAEISGNHNGSLKRALRMIDVAKAAGADFVKFQAYTPDELVQLRGDGLPPQQWADQGYTMRSLYQKARTPLEWFPDLFEYARKVGIVPFASVFGRRSLVILEICDCPAYKIAKLDNQHAWLQDMVLKTRKPVLISTAGAAGKIVGNNWADATLYCPGEYPCAIEDVKLPDAFSFGGYCIGVSSHCLDPLLPLTAVARGAKLLEYHFQLEDELSELEANVSLRADEFAAMVSNVRRVEAMLA